MQNNGRADAVSRVVSAFVLGFWGFLSVVILLFVIFGERSERWEPEIRLALVLVGTVTVVIAASGITAWIFSRLSSNGDSGQVLRESVVRFGWLAAPIAAGYGTARVVESVASIFTSTPSSPSAFRPSFTQGGRANSLDDHPVYPYIADRDDALEAAQRARVKILSFLVDLGVDKGPNRL